MGEDVLMRLVFVSENKLFLYSSYERRDLEFVSNSLTLL